MDSISISNIIGMESINTALLILPDVKFCSLPVTAILKYLNNCDMVGILDNMIENFEYIIYQTEGCLNLERVE